MSWMAKVRLTLAVLTHVLLRRFHWLLAVAWTDSAIWSRSVVPNSNRIYQIQFRSQRRRKRIKIGTRCRLLIRSRRTVNSSASSSFCLRKSTMRWIHSMVRLTLNPRRASLLAATFSDSTYNRSLRTLSQSLKTSYEPIWRCIDSIIEFKCWELDWRHKT